jgi:hypothetical protein
MREAALHGGGREDLKHRSGVSCRSGSAGEANVARSRGAGTRFVDALPEDGERRLMLAVLIDAIHAATAHRPTSSQIQSERAWLRERAWIQSEDKSQPFAFANICDALGLDASYVRHRVLRPADVQRPIRVRRYAERAVASWLALSRAAQSPRRAPWESRHTSTPWTRPLVSASTTRSL